MSEYPFDSAWTAYGAGGGNSGSSYSPSPTTDTNSGWGPLLGSILGNSGSNSSQQQSGSNNGSIFSSPTWADLLAGAKFGYAVTKSGQPPKFLNVPASPDQQKLNDLYFQYMTNPGTANNRNIVSAYAQGALNSMHPTWTPPATSTGLTGYNGTANRDFNWQQYFKDSGMGTGTGSGAPSASASPSSGNPGATIGGSGVAGGPGSGTGVFAPVGSSGDPFAGLPTGFGDQLSSSVDPSTLTSFLKTYGKGALELLGGAYSFNPVMVGKAIIDLVHAHGSQDQEQPNQPAGPQDTQQTLSNNPAGQPQPYSLIPQQTVFAPDTAAFFPWQTYGLMYGGGSGGDMFGTGNDIPQRQKKV